MARKKQGAAPAAPSSGWPGVHFLDTLASIPLNATVVATSGILRAAFDAIGEDADVSRSREAARAQGPKAVEEHTAAAAGLARRSAEYAFELAQA
jgi:hypothetical protein